MLSNGGPAARTEDAASIFLQLIRFEVMLEHIASNQSGVDLTSEAVEEMAKYGIKYAQISQFLYGRYRYTNLADAIAEAKRHPTQDDRGVP
jgi:NH3-dependent NAD+ synthetase